MVIEIFLILIGALLLWFLEDARKYKGLPPGPLRFPLLGNLVQLALEPTKLPSAALRGLARKYGNLILVRMGMIDFVVFSSHDVIMELLQTEDVGNRKMFPYMAERCEGGNVGLVTSNGERWENLRRFTIRTLREFGFGKSASMDIVINEEATNFIEYLKSNLKSTSDNVIHVENGGLFDSTVLNILWRLVTGKAHDLSDERITKMMRLSREYLNATRVDDISICNPILRELFPKMTGWTVQQECVTNLKRFMEEVIQQHVDMGTFMDNPNSYIDMFLKKIEEEKSKGINEAESHFNHTTHVYAILDLFQAGSDTTSKTLTFVFLHLIRNPDIQAKLYEEIVSVFGDKEDTEDNEIITVSISMKARFPLTQAVILETIRLNDVVPIPGPYECHHDLNFRGYRIPKGTPLLVNLESIHYQESIWGDPTEFRPKRFLKPDGSLDTKLAEFVIGFSKGKRMCFGQWLAETTLFIYLIAVLKAFKFEKAPGKPEPSVVAKVGLIYSSHPFWAKITLRYQNNGSI